jgi:hypothetical protein
MISSWSSAGSCLRREGVGIVDSGSKDGSDFSVSRAVRESWKDFELPYILLIARVVN